MADTFIRYPLSGVAVYASLSVFPATAGAGELAVARDTDTLYVFDESTVAWLAIGAPTVAFSLGTFGSTPNANGATMALGVLTLQPASGTQPGGLSTGAQTIGGAKTFSAAISASNLSGTNTGDVTLTAVGSSPNGNGASLTGQALTLQPADATNPGILTAGTQSIAGEKTFLGDMTVGDGDAATYGTGLTVSFADSDPHQIGLKNDDLEFYLYMEPSGGGNFQFGTFGSPIIYYIGDYAPLYLAADGGVQIGLTSAGGTPTADGVKTLQVIGNEGQTANIFEVNYDGSTLFSVRQNQDSGLSETTFTRAIVQQTIRFSTSDGPTLSATDHTLQVARSSGVDDTPYFEIFSPDFSELATNAFQIRDDDQTFFSVNKVGNGVFLGTVAASNLSGTNTGDVTLGAVGASPNANGASLSSQALTLQPADATNPGVVTAGTQTLGGNKSIAGSLSIQPTADVTALVVQNFNFDNEATDVAQFKNYDGTVIARMEQYGNFTANGHLISQSGTLKLQNGVGGLNVYLINGGVDSSYDLFIPYLPPTDGSFLRNTSGGALDWAAPAAAQADSTAILLADLVTDFNSLLAKLRAAGFLAT